MSIETIGRALAEAGRLEAVPLIVYGAKEPPEGAEPLAAIDRCVGKAIYTLAVEEMPPAYIGPSAKAGCCPGGQAWLGLSPFAEMLKYFISTGTPKFRNGAAEYLKRCPELVDESMQVVGKISMPSENLVIQRTEGIATVNDCLCIILFGRAESVRNICTLQHFGTSEALSSVTVPWGPMCASLVTYASGMASGMPGESMILGPTDPTVNPWFPPDLVSISIPMHVASRMADDLERSFIEKRPEVAYPSARNDSLR